MIVVFLRHSVAMDRDEFAQYCLKKGIDPDDELRPLTLEGMRRLRGTSKGLLKLIEDTLGAPVRPVVISSPLIRAQQTASYFMKFGMGVEGTKKKVTRKKARPMTAIKVGPLRRPWLTTKSLNPNATPIDFRNWLYDWMHRSGALRINRANIFVFIGHEPQLSEVISYLISGEPSNRYPVKKGGAVALEVGPTVAPGEGRLLWSVTPWILRRLN